MLSKRNKILLLAVILIQAVFFSGWFLLESAKLSDPKSRVILVKILPVDPRDYISGNYMILRYEFSNAWSFNNNYQQLQGKEGKEVFAVLKQQDKLFVPDYISFEKPEIRPDQVVLKGVVTSYGAMEFGIEKYFINEAVKTPDRGSKIEALLLVGEDSTARIQKLLVNDQEFK
jgi:uncharacterized membrane-anchored protein